MSLGDIGKIILIAIVTLPFAGGIPLAILAYIDFRRDQKRAHPGPLQEISAP